MAADCGSLRQYRGGYCECTGVYQCVWNGSTPFRMVRIFIRMLRVPFEWFEFAFECFEFLSNGLNLDLDALNPFRMVRIWIRKFLIHLEWFDSLSNV